MDFMRKLRENASAPSYNQTTYGQPSIQKDKGTLIIHDKNVARSIRNSKGDLTWFSKRNSYQGERGGLSVVSAALQHAMIFFQW